MHASRRKFLRQAGLAVGALTVSQASPASILYQKRTTPLKAPPADTPTLVDFRYAPGSWLSPLGPGGRGSSYVSESGALLLPQEAGGGGESVTFSFEPAGAAPEVSQRCEEPHLPFVSTAIVMGSAGAEVAVFGSSHPGEGPVDNVTVRITPGGEGLTLRIAISSPAGMEYATETEEDDASPHGVFTVVKSGRGLEHPFLVLDAKAEAVREGSTLVLRVPVAPAAAAGSATIVYRLRIPAGTADAGDLIDGFGEFDERATAERDRWSAWKTARAPRGWDIPGAHGAFSIAGARLLDQEAGTDGGAPEGSSPAPSGSAEAPPDFVDEHFISEAEIYLGREKEARSRIEAVWNLEDSSGLLVGAGGPSNTKEMCAAVYSLCRNAELTGDWSLFDELYPDAYNALDALRVGRDKAAALSTPSENGRLRLLPEGSPGRGWAGEWVEMTNTIWALIALRALLEISDRRFLVRKSETREFYGQLRLAFITAVRGAAKTHKDGFSWFPVVSAPVAGAGGDAPPLPPQAGLGSLAAALYPGLLFKNDERVFKDFPALVASCLQEDVPAATGPEMRRNLVDASMAAQALIWFGLAGKASEIQTGFLNHAAPVFVWPPPDGTQGAGARFDLRANAEAIRYVRHALVMEDVEVLRLFDGVSLSETSAAKALRLEATPTRWGRVTVALEPVDRRTWKVSYRREPGGDPKGPPLKSVEMPRVLPPNFRFDVATPARAIKNGPRVIVDGGELRWEAHLRDLRR